MDVYFINLIFLNETNKMKILVFTSSSCPHCPLAERLVKEISPRYSDKGLVHEKIRTKTSEGRELAENYNIRGVPTILFVGDSGDELGRIVGVPSEKNLVKKIEKLLGIKKSFFGKRF